MSIAAEKKKRKSKTQEILDSTEYFEKKNFKDDNGWRRRDILQGKYVSIFDIFEIKFKKRHDWVNKAPST